MKNSEKFMSVLVGCLVMITTNYALAQDWPQWRGVNRDARVTGFTAPDTWPQELNKEWEIDVGVGTDATPVLVDDKLYVFTRNDEQEVLLCLNAETGEELWKDSYPEEDTTSADRAHSGPRSTPAVADGKIVTFGVNGTLSCYDTETQELLWRKTDYTANLPQFHTAMSPVAVDGMVVGHFGGPQNAAVVAYDLVTGEKKWENTDVAGPSFASPVIMTVEDTKIAVVMTDSNIIGLNIADGALLWEIAFAPEGRGSNTTTPVVEGQTLYYGGVNRGITAVKINKEADQFVIEQLWANQDNSVEYSTPVLKEGLLYCMAASTSSIFCINTENGQTAWTEPTETALRESGLTLIPVGFGGGGNRGGRGGGMGGGPGGRGGGGMGGGSAGGGGWGSIVDAGEVIIAIDITSELVVLKPSKQQYDELASYKVSDGSTYAYPVVSGNRIYIMDQTTIALWSIE